MSKTDNPEPSNGKRKGCLIAVFLVVGLLFVAGNFFPPISMMGCAVTPSRFRGRVVDQNGDPVAEARISISRHTTFFSKGTRSELKADDEGNFSIFGIFGAGLYVAASKAGYYPLYESNTRKGMEESAEAYWGGYDHRSSPDKVEVFRLWKAMPGEKLIHHHEKSYRIDRDGTPKVINLVPDEAYHAHSIEIRCWTHDEKRVNGRGYDWRCEIRIINGGLRHRADEFDFEAPKDDYLPLVVIDMPWLVNGQANKSWRGDVAHDYFLRFDDGVFARAKVRMIAGGDHFVVFESVLNPKTGSRNLSVVPK